MDKLLNKIKDDIKSGEFQQKELAKKLNVSPQSFTYYLKGENEMSFSLYYKLINLIYKKPSVIEKMLIDFARFTPKKGNIKEILEFSSNCNFNQIFDISLERAKRESDGQVTAMIYSLFQKRNQFKITGEELFKEIDDININEKKKSVQLDILIQIGILYSYLDMKAYKVALHYSENVLRRITSMKDSYLKASYEFRVKEVLAIALMRQGNTEESKEVALSLIHDKDADQFPVVINSLYILLAELHAFSDKEISLSYMYRAIKNYQDLKLYMHYRRKSSLMATHDFIKIYHKDFSNLYLQDNPERAHYYASQEDELERNKAVQILMDIKEENGTLTPFQMYYWALATGNTRDMEMACKEFYKNGEFHYCQLAER